ncbi:MAG: hypothetical protein HUU35_13960 [Armatimonadetes bacterium]|nr:hypothetical protein [Armatimonadota bacterium]
MAQHKPNRAVTDFVTKAKSLGEALLDWGTWLGLVVCGAVLAYIFYGIFSGQLFNLPRGEVGRVRESVDTMTRLLMYAAIAVAFVATIRTKEAKVEIGAGVIAAGLGLWLGFPMFARYMQEVKGGSPNAAVSAIVQNFGVTGRIMLLAMVWPVLEWAWRFVRAVPLKRAQQELVDKARLRREGPKGTKAAIKPTFLSPCWHLPYCRDYLVAMCPAFKARKRCWKFGGGCFCDNSMIEAMLVGVKKGGGQAYMQSEIAARTGVMKQRQRKPPCKRCFIYLEHENLKYNVMHPLAYPLAAVIMYLLYEPIVRPVWLASQVFLTNLWGKLAYQAVTETPESIAQVFGMEWAMMMFTVLLGMFLLLGLLRLCELWCFKWKL